MPDSIPERVTRLEELVAELIKALNDMAEEGDCGCCTGCFRDSIAAILKKESLSKE